MKHVLPLLVVLIASSVFAQNRVVTLNGLEFEGEIIRADADTIVLRKHDSSIVAFPKSILRNIEYNVVPRDQQAFWSLGASIGTPGALHIAGAYDIRRFGMRVSAGWIGTAYGAQCALGYKLRSEDHLSHEVGILVGVSHIDLENTIEDIQNGQFVVEDNIYDWLYAGVAYTLHLSGIFAEIGLSVGQGTFSNPQLVGQLGYLFEFR